MSDNEIGASLQEGRAHGCVEALFCIGDKPERSFNTYSELLASRGHDSTVSWLVAAGRSAIEHGLLPHTNAGLLTRDDMIRLKAVNASLGLMLENTSERMMARGMPHFLAPDKAPSLRLEMLRIAGELSIPFTTGLLIGIGETERERIDTLIAIRDLHAQFGHIQEVIIQNFRVRPAIPMHAAEEPSLLDLARTIAIARLVLPTDVSIQAPPNLSPNGTRLLIQAGLNDFGGVSPVTPDYINPAYPWPQLTQLAAECAESGFALSPRLPIYKTYASDRRFVDPALSPALARAEERLAAEPHFRFQPPATSVTSVHA